MTATPHPLEGRHCPNCLGEWSFCSGEAEPHEHNDRTIPLGPPPPDATQGLVVCAWCGLLLLLDLDKTGRWRIAVPKEGELLLEPEAAAIIEASRRHFSRVAWESGQWRRN